MSEPLEMEVVFHFGENSQEYIDAMTERRASYLIDRLKEWDAKDLKALCKYLKEHPPVDNSSRRECA